MNKRKHKKKNRYMYGGFLSLLFMVGMMLLPVQAATTKTTTASSESKVVRVGYYAASGFQEYDEATDTYSGYGYEFLMGIGQYTGWTYEFVPCGFSEGLTMLADGEIDLMNNVSMTAEREAVYDFSTLSSGENVAYLTMKAGDTRVAQDDLVAIGTIKIGLAKDSIYSERLVNYLEKNNISPDIVWYDSRDAVTVAFDAGDVDAYIVTSSTLKDEHVILSFSPDAYYIALTKGNDVLLQELNSAMTEFRANDPYFEVHLKEKYYRQVVESYAILTEQEKAYLVEHPVVRVLYQPDWYPICYKDSEGQMAGAIRGIYDLLTERTGLQFEYVAADDPAKNEADDLMGAYQTQIMAEQPMDFSNAVNYGVKLTKSFIAPPLTEVAEHVLSPGDTLSLVEGDYLSEVCERIYGNDYKYIYCDSVTACIEAVQTGRADGTVLISYESEYYRQQHKYSGLSYTIIDEGSYSLCIGVDANADPLLYDIVEKGLNAISNSEVTNVFNKTLVALQREDIQSFIDENPLLVVTVLAAVAALFAGIIVGQIFIKKLRKQNEIIREKNEALQRANQSTADFYARMSHDMRTPMNGILGMARLSHEETEVAVLKENIGKIEDSGEYLLSLINDTLDFQRIESGKLTLTPEIVNCQEVLQNILDMVQPSIRKKNLDLQVINHNVVLDCDIFVDPVRMKQIFLNLLSNAVKFTPDGGTITVAYECLAREGMISHDRFIVKDTGIGMSADFIENHMFKPFSQEHNEVTGQYAGSGLGLSIVKSLVELMGGTIEVASELGRGTTFTIWLDFKRVTDVEAERMHAMADRQQTSAVQKLKGLRILMAEDHPLNAEITVKLLKRVGCEVTWVQDGRACVEMFNQSEADYFDTILMDIRMPVMTGLEAAKAIRALERTDAMMVPIIAMTANAYDEDIKKSLAAGMNEHLAKPIDPAGLYSTIIKVVCK